MTALDKAGCFWEPYPPLAFGDQRSLVAIPTKANFTFQIPEGQEPALNAMGLPGDGHDCNTKRRHNSGSGSTSVVSD